MICPPASNMKSANIRSATARQPVAEAPSGRAGKTQLADRRVDHARRRRIPATAPWCGRSCRRARRCPRPNRRCADRGAFPRRCRRGPRRASPGFPCAGCRPAALGRRRMQRLGPHVVVGASPGRARGELRANSTALGDDRAATRASIASSSAGRGRLRSPDEASAEQCDRAALLPRVELFLRAIGAGQRVALVMADDAIGFGLDQRGALAGAGAGDGPCGRPPTRPARRCRRPPRRECRTRRPSWRPRC